jgi:cyanophycinase
MGRGYLVIIGGAEDKNGDSEILKHISEMIYKDETLTILTTATKYPKETGEKYRKVFSRLGVQNLHVLDINKREMANDEGVCSIISDSQAIFFTGGDQLRITSILGGTKALDEIWKVYEKGGIIIGTSAGASVMSSTMVVKGKDNEPPKKCTTKMAPGIGLLDKTIIDQHFEQRGRFGRLLCSVAENPEIIGIGIDEDTAIKVHPDLFFEVIGSNAVTIIDGSTIKSSNVSELEQNEVLAIVGVTVHTLPKNYGYDIIKKEVVRLKGN